MWGCPNLQVASNGLHIKLDMSYIVKTRKSSDVVTVKEGVEAKGCRLEAVILVC